MWCVTSFRSWTSRLEKRSIRNHYSHISTKKVLDTRMKLAAETALMQKNKAAANKGAGEKTTPEENIIEEDPDMIF